MVKHVLILYLFAISVPFLANEESNEAAQLPEIHINEHTFIRFLKQFCQRYEEQFPEKIKAAQKKYKKALELNYKSEELKKIVLADCNCHPNEAMYQKYAKEVLEQAREYHANEMECAYQQMLAITQKIKEIATMQIQEMEYLQESITDADTVLKSTHDDTLYAQGELAQIIARVQLRYTLRQQAMRFAYHQHAIDAITHILDELDPSRWSFFNPLSWLFS
ncbi:MAG: hypothetical protein WD068_00680 [Candidatus Babeliales bacterium]